MQTAPTSAPMEMYASLRAWVPQAESFLCLNAQDALNPTTGTLILPDLDEVLAAPTPLAIGIVRQGQLDEACLVQDPATAGDRDRRGQRLLIPAQGYTRIPKPGSSLAPTLPQGPPMGPDFERSLVEEALASYLRNLASLAIAGHALDDIVTEEIALWDTAIRRMVVIALRRNGTPTINLGWLTLDQQLYVHLTKDQPATADECRVSGSVWYRILAANVEQARALGWWQYSRGHYLEIPDDLVRPFRHHLRMQQWLMAKRNDDEEREISETFPQAYQCLPEGWGQAIFRTVSILTLPAYTDRRKALAETMGLAYATVPPTWLPTYRQRHQQQQPGAHGPPVDVDDIESLPVPPCFRTVVRGEGGHLRDRDRFHTSTWLAALGRWNVDAALYFVQRQRRGESGSADLASRLHTAFLRAQQRGERGPTCFRMTDPDYEKKDAKSKDTRNVKTSNVTQKKDADDKKKKDGSDEKKKQDDGRAKARCPMGSCLECAKTAGLVAADAVVAPFSTPAGYVRAALAMEAERLRQTLPPDTH